MSKTKYRISNTTAERRIRHTDLQDVGEVTVVKTVAALQSAVKAGEPYIGIQAHLDFTGADTVTCDSGECILGTGDNGYIPATVKSIRVHTSQTYACQSCYLLYNLPEK